MVDRLIGPVAAHQLAFLALAALAFTLRLLPNSPSYEAFPSPDLLLVVALCWTLRRPAFMPFWLVALVFFVEDLLLFRPPGLWAALSLVATEFLRSRTGLAREMNFGAEWLLVSVVIVVMTLANRLIFGFAFLPQTPLAPVLSQLLATVIIYPAIAGLSVLAFGLRKPATGETDARGRRI